MKSVVWRCGDGLVSATPAVAVKSWRGKSSDVGRVNGHVMHDAFNQLSFIIHHLVSLVHHHHVIQAEVRHLTSTASHPSQKWCATYLKSWRLRCRTQHMPLVWSSSPYVVHFDEDYLSIDRSIYLSIYLSLSLSI